jgi:hypothetical protein
MWSTVTGTSVKVNGAGLVNAYVFPLGSYTIDENGMITVACGAAGAADVVVVVVVLCATVVVLAVDVVDFATVVFVADVETAGGGAGGGTARTVAVSKPIRCAP